MNVDVKDVENLLSRLKKRPFATLFLMIVAIAIIAGIAWVTSCAQEKGRRIGAGESETNSAANSAALPSIPNADPHTYSFMVRGQPMQGTSSNPFQNAQGYQARVEACDRWGAENLYAETSCYVTLRPTTNLTISNSRNPTAATYQDGSVAPVCCMGIGVSEPEEISRTQLREGAQIRATFARGEEVQIILLIPEADPNRVLDAISFSPGEGAPTVLFPIRGNLTSHFLSAQILNEHGDDPAVQRFIQDTIRLRNATRARARSNRQLR